MSKLTLNDLVNNPDFSGIIISKNLIEKLEINNYPFVKLVVENDINKNANISSSMAGCILHDEGWGFINIK